MGVFIFSKQFNKCNQEDFSSHGHLSIRTMSMLVSLNSDLISALACILGKLFGHNPACALHKLFNYYFSTLQHSVHFAIVLVTLLLMQKYYACIDNIITLTPTLTLQNVLKTIVASTP